MKTSHAMNNEETAASLTGSARTDALRALRVLAETAETPDSGDSDTPPLPDHLRDQWLEAYGQAAPAAAKPVAAGVRARAGENWLSRLTEFFRGQRLAWASGFAVAATAAVVLMMQQPETVTGRDPIRTRGTGTITPGDAARLIVVAPADKAAPLVSELTRAYPARTIERMDAAPSTVEDDAIIIDTAAGTAQRAGKSPGVKNITGDAFTSPDSVIMAIEGLDEPEPR